MSGGLFIWSFVLFGVIIIAFAMVALVRRRYFSSESFPKQGFTISELRQLRDAGQMSTEEFERARAALIGATAPKSTEIPRRSDNLRK